MNRIAATILSMEALVILFAVPVAVNLSDVNTAAAWAAGGGVAVLCVVAAATVRRGRIGWMIGHFVQVLAIVSGFVVTAMFVLGAIFALMWVVLLRIGPEVEQAQAAREASSSLSAEQRRDDDASPS